MSLLSAGRMWAALKSCICTSDAHTCLLYSSGKKRRAQSLNDGYAGERWDPIV